MHGDWGGSQPDIEWSSFISTILWNLQGFDNLGCIAGEVKNVKVSYPLGVSVATAAIAVFYVLPVLGEDDSRRCALKVHVSRLVDVSGNPSVRDDARVCPRV